MYCYKCGTQNDLYVLTKKQKDREYKTAICKVCSKAYRDARRLIVFKHYGDMCACCGEQEPLFLTIDHVNNDGNAEVTAQGVRITGYVLYAKIIRNNYPDTYQLLCMNCNFGKRMNNGTCPHTVALV